MPAIGPEEFEKGLCGTKNPVDVYSPRKGSDGKRFEGGTKLGGGEAFPLSVGLCHREGEVPKKEVATKLLRGPLYF